MKLNAIAKKSIGHEILIKIFFLFKVEFFFSFQYESANICKFTPSTFIFKIYWRQMQTVDNSLYLLGVFVSYRLIFSESQIKNIKSIRPSWLFNLSLLSFLPSFSFSLLKSLFFVGCALTF